MMPAFIEWNVADTRKVNACTYISNSAMFKQAAVTHTSMDQTSKLQGTYSKDDDARYRAGPRVGKP